MSQPERLLAYLREHPGTSAREIIEATDIVKYSARISDLRAAGHRIEAKRVGRGVWRYHLVTAPAQVGFDGTERLLA